MLCCRNLWYSHQKQERGRPIWYSSFYRGISLIFINLSMCFSHRFFVNFCKGTFERMGFDHSHSKSLTNRSGPAKNNLKCHIWWVPGLLCECFLGRMFNIFVVIQSSGQRDILLLKKQSSCWFNKYMVTSLSASSGTIFIYDRNTNTSWRFYAR